VNAKKTSNDGQFVSRGGDKLASVAAKLGLDFRGKVVLDVGSSTGGFTDFALRHGAGKVIAVDSGTDQLHRSLRADPRVLLHEKTDIREFITDERIDIAVIDVSFISLQQVLPAAAKLANIDTQIVAMVKPQFEAKQEQLNRGVLKNQAMRRRIFKDFEAWAKQKFIVENKADSAVAGVHGNLERFYLLRIKK